MAVNHDAVQGLSMRCKLIKETIEGSLKGRDESRVPAALSESIRRLIKCVCFTSGSAHLMA
jgi:hypothetical protein